MTTTRRVLIAAAVGLGLLGPGSAFPVTLEDAVQQTIDTNPDVLINVHERKARDQELKQAQAGYKPAVDFSAGYGFERSNNPTTRNRAGDGDEDLSRRETGLTLRQMVFDGFATKNEIERQRARIDSAAYRIQGDAEKTALRAVEVYLEVLRQHELEQITRENRDAHRRILEQIALRSRQGIGRKADLDQVEARVSLAESNLIAAENNVADAGSNYLRVVGDMPEGLIRPPTRDDLPGDGDEAVSMAIGSNPTLKSAIVDVTATMAQHRAGKRTYLPRLDVELSRNWDDNLDGARGVNNDAQAMLRMRWNLYNGGADVARRTQTAHLITEASEVRNRTCRQVVESMRLSFEAHQKLARQLEALERYRGFAEQTLDAYTQQFNIGQRTLLDVLDSENELFVARRDVINAAYDRQFAEYRMLAAAGMLLGALAIELPPEAQPVGNTEIHPMGHCEWRSNQYRKAGQESAHTAGKVTTMPQYQATAEGGAQRETVGAGAVLPAAARTSTADADVLAVLDDWADAWSTQDPDAYLQHYSASFVPSGSLDRSAWEAQRRERLINPDYISVSILNPEVEWRADKPRVAFRQRYRSSTYNDEVEKVLDLVEEDGRWKIVNEKSTP